MRRCLCALRTRSLKYIIWICWFWIPLAHFIQNIYFIFFLHDFIGLLRLTHTQSVVRERKSEQNKERKRMKYYCRTKKVHSAAWIFKNNTRINKHSRNLHGYDIDLSCHGGCPRQLCTLWHVLCLRFFSFRFENRSWPNLKPLLENPVFCRVFLKPRIFLDGSSNLRCTGF